MEKFAVTGAYGYSGSYIAGKLLKEGKKVCTLTNSIPARNPARYLIEEHPLDFNSKHQLINSLRGVDVLFNTYWVRFNYKNFTHAQAVENSRTLFDAAKTAGVRKVVHLSITNPSKDSGLSYFSGKAEVEEALINSGMEYSILRPTVLFGKEDILMNNIAWFARNFPFFAMFGDGEYKLQPVYVEDLAELAIAESGKSENNIINAIGPETFTYKELVREIIKSVGRNIPVLSMPEEVTYYAGKIVGFFKNDVVSTRAEIEGLMRNLLYVDDEPACETKFTEWINEHSDELGIRYMNELKLRK